MALRVLVFAGLRIVALYMVAQVLSSIPVVLSMHLRMGEETVDLIGSALVVSGPLIGAALLWVFSARLTSGVVRNCDPTLHLHLTLENAYAVGFVVLGLDFFLASIAGTLIGFYQAFNGLSYPVGDLDRPHSMALFARSCITLMMGFAALIGHRIWARKLVALGSKPSA